VKNVDSPSVFGHRGVGRREADTKNVQIDQTCTTIT